MFKLPLYFYRKSREVRSHHEWSLETETHVDATCEPPGVKLSTCEIPRDRRRYQMWTASVTSSLEKPLRLLLLSVFWWYGTLESRWIRLWAFVWCSQALLRLIFKSINGVSHSVPQCRCCRSLLKHIFNPTETFLRRKNNSQTRLVICFVAERSSPWCSRAAFFRHHPSIKRRGRCWDIHTLCQMRCRAISINVIRDWGCFFVCVSFLPKKVVDKIVCSTTSSKMTHMSVLGFFFSRSGSTTDSCHQIHALSTLTVLQFTGVTGPKCRNTREYKSMKTQGR